MLIQTRAALQLMSTLRPSRIKSRRFKKKRVSLVKIRVAQLRGLDQARHHQVIPIHHQERRGRKIRAPLNRISKWNPSCKRKPLTRKRRSSRSGSWTISWLAMVWVTLETPATWTLSYRYFPTSSFSKKSLPESRTVSTSNPSNSSTNWPNW